MSPHSLTSLIQVSAPDTVVTVLARDGLQTAADVSLVVLVVCLVVMLLVALALLLQVRTLSRAVHSLGSRALERAGPLVDRGRDVADNVEFITRALRTDVERLNASVKALTDRLHQASDRMEERIEEFNALMEMVQAEAEDIFIDTASTMRGVRAGARSLGADGERFPEEAEALEPDALDDEPEVPDPDLQARGAVPGT